MPTSFVFISYSRKDKVIVNRMQRHLETDGFSTWKDDRLVGGTRFDDVIEQKIRESSCVLVLWSKAAVSSQYVKDESALALDLQRLVPAAVDDCEMPMRFRSLHTHQLTEWSEPLPGPDYERLKADLASFLSAGAPKRHARAHHLLARLLAAGARWSAALGPPVAGAIALIALGLALFRTTVPPGAQSIREPVPIPVTEKAATDQLLLVGRLYEIRSPSGATMRVRVHEAGLKEGKAKVTVSDANGLSQDLAFVLTESKEVHLSTGRYALRLDGVADNGALFSIAR